MALLRPDVKVRRHTANTAPEWDESFDSLFNTLINPDSFHNPDTTVESTIPGDLFRLFDSSSSSDVCPMQIVDLGAVEADSPCQEALSFEREPAASQEQHETAYPPAGILSNPSGAAEAQSADCDLSLRRQLEQFLQIHTSHASPQHPTPATSPRSPQFCTNGARPRILSPLAIRKKQPAVLTAAHSPTRAEKPARGSSLSPSQSSATSTGMQSDRWVGGLEAVNDQFSLRRSSGDRLSHQKTASLLAGFADLAVIQNSSYRSDHLISPVSNGYIQHPNTPIASPLYDQPNSSSSSSDVERGGYAAMTMNQQNGGAKMLLTPPSTQPMPNSAWPAHPGQGSTPDFVETHGKAEPWWAPQTNNSTVTEQPVNGQSTAGASSPNLLQGLGISSVEEANIVATDLLALGDSQPSTSAASLSSSAASDGLCRSGNAIGFGPVVPSTIAPAALMRSTPARSPTAYAYSASASPNMNGAYAAHPAYLPTASSPTPPSQISNRHSIPVSPQFYYRSHSRTPSGSSSYPAMTSTLISDQAASYPQGMKPSHTPNQHSLSNGSRTSHSNTTAHRRSKSNGQSNHQRRRSVGPNNTSPRHASAGFVNFTPEDSKKILNGVAPSGSSKTKARREKEAEEKRRKISEAARRLVLEAGGDPKTLDQEDLFVLDGTL